MSTRPGLIIKQRPVDTAVHEAATRAGFHPVAARIVASRPFPGTQALAYVSPALSDLDPPDGLPDIEKAANRLAMAVITGEVIGLSTDVDVDGVTSHAVLWSALVNHFGHPAAKVRSYAGHRLQEGYGLSAPLAQRILADTPRPDLVVTADNGSSDEPRIRLLKEAGIDVIVSDHHELPVEGPPPSAYAVVSPMRADSAYPDPLIAGCMVAWLLCAATRAVLIEAGHLPPDARSLADLLPFVSLGTVADCVSLARSRNNRAVVRYGLKHINAGTRPCWRAIRPLLGDAGKPLTAESLAFGIGPRINARGRLSEPLAGVKFLLSTTYEEAAEWAAVLERENEERKEIERTLKEAAVTVADDLVAQGRRSLVVWLPDGHSGVHGIVASRVVERHGRPTVLLSPKFGSDELVSGSARSIDGFHMRDALQHVADEYPDLFVAFGGHAGAAGMTLHRADIGRFAEAFEEAAAAQLGARALGPVLWTDGALRPEEISLDLVDALAALDPYGRECDAPVFEGEFEVLSVRPIGNGTHLKLLLRAGDRPCRAVWFQAVEDASQPIPLVPGQRFSAAFSISDNVFQGSRDLQLRVVERLDP